MNDEDMRNGVPEGDRHEKRRRIAIWIGWGKTALVCAAALYFLSWGTGQDPAGRAMFAGFVGIPLIYLSLFVFPALYLAYRGKLLGLSFALLLLPDPILVLLVNALNGT